jgi:DNA end-binding protein Ku
MAAIWEGSIQFGLVEIPVVLRPAEQGDELKTTMLDRRDLSPVGYRRYNKKTGEEVPWEEIVRGFEVDDDRYVVLTDEELEKADPKTTKTVEIVEFVDASEIDPAFFDRPYYLEPKRRGSKSYALLRETLRRTGKIGIARVVLRTRQYLAAVTVRGPALVLNLLRYAHELRDPGQLDVPAEQSRDLKVSPAELRMAEQLVQGMSEPWKPEQFHDDYRDQVLELVRHKARTGKVRTIRAPGAGEKPGKVIDLMSMLKRSVEQARDSRPAPAARKPPRARAGARSRRRSA